MIRAIQVKNPPLVPDPGQTRGVLMKVPDPQNPPPCGGLKIAKTLIFGRFSKFQNPKIFRDKQGGVLMKGGFLNLNIPDRQFPKTDIL